MGFWTGVAQAYRDIDEKRTQDRRIQEERELQQRRIEEERAYQEGVRERERAFAMEQFNTKLENERTMALLTVLGERREASAVSDEAVARTESLATRLGPEAAATETGKALLSNPLAAASVEAQIEELERARAEQDLDLPPLQGQALLDAIEIYGVETAKQDANSLSVEQILGMSSEDLRGEKFFQLYADLSSQGARTPYARLSPEAFRQPDPSTLEEGRRVFGQRVLQRAREEAARLQEEGDVEGFGRLQQAIDNYDLSNPNSSTDLLNQRFGEQAFSGLVQEENPYIQNMREDPLLSPFTPPSREDEIDELRSAIEDPATPPEQRQQLIRILFEDFGVTYP